MNSKDYQTTGHPIETAVIVVSIMEEFPALRQQV
jgi:hypothetical protein